MKSTLQTIFLTSLCVSAWLQICSCSNQELAENKDEDSANHVHTVHIENLVKSDLRKYIEVNGNIRAEKSMSVYPIVSGKIAGARVHLGSEVKKGDVLVYVDPSMPGSHYALNAVTAPISGTVISIPLKEGTRVNTETAVVTIGDLSRLQIITYIPERYAAYLKKGLDAEVVLDAYPDEKFTARISEVSPILDEATHTKEVVLSFEKNDSRINAGMFAAVNLFLKDYKNVFSVPSSCIIEKLGKKYIYLTSDSVQLPHSEQGKYYKAHLIEINADEEISGRTIINFVQPVDQIQNARVVVQGFENLQDESIVNIAE